MIFFDPILPVPKLLWDFSDANSVYKWEPATPPGRRLEEKINRLPYGRFDRFLYPISHIIIIRVILGKDTNWDDFVNVRQFNQSSNWVLGPALGFFPVDWASVALTNSTRKSDGVVWLVGRKRDRHVAITPYSQVGANSFDGAYFDSSAIFLGRSSECIYSFINIGEFQCIYSIQYSSYFNKFNKFEFSDLWR